MRITFLGAAGTVTGSKYLLEHKDQKFLVDCGLFQGLKELRQRNWEELPFEASEIDGVLLTHAHLDHSGYLPLLVKSGFRGKIYCTYGTFDLCKIILPDSGRIQEEDAEDANHYGFSKHYPALPLYTEEDAYECINYLNPVGYDKSFNLGKGLDFHFRRNGHIIGSAAIILSYEGRKIVFSGDLGRMDEPVMKAPEAIEEADYLVMESTYGDREHKNIDVADQLEKTINETEKRHGKVVIPSFAVGRAQEIIYHLSRLITEDRINRLMPIFLDSPMSINASEIFKRHPEDHKLSYDQCRKIFGNVKYIQSVADSKKIMEWPVPCIIISASGMATGGRVLHHLRNLAPDEKNTIILAGYQAEGTRGGKIYIGNRNIKIHGVSVPIRAKVESLENISAHADSREIIEWLGNFKTKPKLFITHGEKAASMALGKKIMEKFGWECVIPEMDQSLEI